MWNLSPKMHRKLFIITLVCCFMNSYASKCTLDDVPKTREFASLLEYQRNKLSFNRLDEAYAGNSVNFSFGTVERLTKNTCITYSSDYITTIDLSNKAITYIDDGAFLSLTCLYKLDLSKNLIANLTNNTFADLSNLRSLNLSNNHLTYIYSNVFSVTRRLVKLDLSYNNISDIDSSAFVTNVMLQLLNISHNCMKHIDYMFSELVNLKYLYLDHNSLAIIPTNLFSNNINLEKLDLSGNQMVLLNLMADSFHPERMKLFNLSNNYLIRLNVSKFVNQFANTKTSIDLNDNQFYCNDWKQYLQEFRCNNVTIVAGRNLTARRHINGIACDNLNFTLPVDYREGNNSLHRDQKDNSKQYRKHNNESDFQEVNKPSRRCLFVEPVTDEDNHLSFKYVIVALTVIGSAFFLFLTLDYMLHTGFRQKLTRRVRVCLFPTPLSSSVNTSYIQLNRDL